MSDPNMTPRDLLNRVLECPMVCSTRAEIWHRYLSAITDGQALEFGVWNGRSINYMADVRPNASFVGFDSFEGLPEAWVTGHPAGHFKTDLKKIKWRSNISIRAGWFQDTLPKFVDSTHKSRRRIQAIHIDCDLGSSTRAVFKALTSLILVDKPILLFDEFYNYPGYENHEFQAFLDWHNETHAPFQVIARIASRQQVLIELL
jgi:hypothetical protein